jgi:hypothetical protein
MERTIQEQVATVSEVAASYRNDDHRRFDVKSSVENEISSVSYLNGFNPMCPRGGCSD